jgi:hypothetical protein
MSKVIRKFKINGKCVEINYKQPQAKLEFATHPAVDYDKEISAVALYQRKMEIWVTKPQLKKILKTLNDDEFEENSSSYKVSRKGKIR